MARCSHDACATWRPDTVVRLTGAGLTVDGAWFCSALCVESSTRARLSTVKPSDPHAPHRNRLGMLLLAQKLITADQLNRALDGQRDSRRRLGEELVQLGFVNASQVLRGLATQAGISYLTSIDVACVRSAPGGLSPDEVRALGVVPIKFHEKSRHLIVACRAPLPRTALSALRQLTGCTVEPHLATDAELATLMQSYGSSVPAPGRSVNVQDVGAAAARVAEAAARQRAIRVNEAHADTATLVRIHSAGGVDTLFLPRDQEMKPWPAATTLH